jgi:phosphoribosylformylglycinamidine synthase
MLIETTVPLDNKNLIKIGQTINEQQVIINDVKWDLEDLWRANTEKFATVYPIVAKNQCEATAIEQSANVANQPISIVRPSLGQPTAYLPVFPGTNCDYDTAWAFRRAGAKVTSAVFCNLDNKAIFQSIAAMKAHIAQSQILVFSGGFSAGDEPDGSGKFIANVLNYQEITEEIHRLLDRGGLILGICNGFQALVKSGLLPYGRLGTVSKDSPTLFRNDINRHVSCMATTRVASLRSPWLAGFTLGEQHSVAMSHGEGKFVVSEALATQLFANSQVAFQYADGNNINGSLYSIEGIISESGQILGKMGHSERYADNLLKNISGNKRQDIFGTAVRWFLLPAYPPPHSPLDISSFLTTIAIENNS